MSKTYQSLTQKKTKDIGNALYCKIGYFEITTRLKYQSVDLPILLIEISQIWVESFQL